MIRTVDMPRFWYYWSHWISFQSYGFYLLIFNEFRGLTFACRTESDGSCFCEYPSSLIAQGQCAVSGDDVLQVRAALRAFLRCMTIAIQYLDVEGMSFNLYIVILLLVSLVYRILFYLILVVKKR